MHYLNSLLIPIIFLLLFTNCHKDNGTETDTSTYSLTFDIDHQFNGNAISFNELAHTNEAGNLMSFTRLQYLISGIKLYRADGSAEEIDATYAFINPIENRSSFKIDNILNGDFTGIAFTIGLDSIANFSNPNDYAPDHPLNPLLNQMHWDWSQGYIFLSMEGQYETGAGLASGFSYHVAFEENLMPFIYNNEAFSLDSDKTVQLVFDVAEAFKNPATFDILVDGAFSHSSSDNGIANTIRDNMSDAIKIIGYE